MDKLYRFEHQVWNKKTVFHFMWHIQLSSEGWLSLASLTGGLWCRGTLNRPPPWSDSPTSKFSRMGMLRKPKDSCYIKIRYFISASESLFWHKMMMYHTETSTYNVMFWYVDVLLEAGEFVKYVCQHVIIFIAQIKCGYIYFLIIISWWPFQRVSDCLLGELQSLNNGTLSNCIRV